MRLKLLSLGLALIAWGYLRFVPNPLLPTTVEHRVLPPLSHADDRRSCFHAGE